MGHEFITTMSLEHQYTANIALAGHTRPKARTNGTRNQQTKQTTKIRVEEAKE